MSDLGQGARGYAQWISGLLETGILGYAKMRNRRRLAVAAFRCPNCTHLELFA